MSYSKRQGSCGIAYQAAPGTAAPDPAHYLICGTCKVPAEPQYYEQANSINAESLGMQAAGFDTSFSIDDVEPTAAHMGYLLWAFFGGYSRAADVHTITPQFDSKFLTVFKDQGAVFMTGLRVKTAVGGRIESLVIDQQEKSFCKVAVSGQACAPGTSSFAMAPTVSLIDANRPMSWAALRAGTVKLGYGTLTRVADTGITGTKITLSRELQPDGADLNSDQPGDIVQGGREVLVEYTRNFKGDAAALAEYLVYLNTTAYLSYQARWTMGTNYVDITVPHMKITADPLPDVGTGTDVQVLTISAKGFLNASSNICDVVVKDGNSTLDYSAL